jgi:dTDP-3-amino-3,4,6-trideoxy-alpha-D-glucose transaminase
MQGISDPRRARPPPLASDGSAARIYGRSMLISDRSSVRVPFVDLAPVHETLKDGILSDVAALIDDCAFTNGPQVHAFEEQFAAFCGTRHAVGVSSGLDALRLALLAAGCSPGDEVVVPANTFIATLEAVTQAGARPVLVDVSERDYNLDVDAVEEALGRRTRFLLPVHLYGQMADMRALRELAAAHSLTIIEDACQAHGATRDGIRAGCAGRAAAFSFYPGKNLGAMGDGGALVTDDEELASVARALREHGQRRKHVHEFVGYTARLDTIQAIVLAHKLPLLEGWNAQRLQIAEAYLRELRGIGDLILPPVAPASEPVWHLFVVRTGDPNGLAAFLSSRGVSTARHYPNPPHLTAAYAWLGHPRGAFPVTEALAAQLLSLPIFPGMGDREISAVVERLREYFAGE